MFRGSCLVELAEDGIVRGHEHRVRIHRRRLPARSSSGGRIEDPEFVEGDCMCNCLRLKDHAGTKEVYGIVYGSPRSSNLCMLSISP